MFLFQEDPGAQQQVESVAAKASKDVSDALHGLQDGDFQKAWPLLESYVVPAIGVLLLLIVAYMAARFISRIVSAPVQKRVDETLGRFIGKAVYYAIMLSVLIAVLGKFGFQVTSFAAILASAGFAIGMAFQGTLSNFAAGIMLLVFRPFKVGDFICAAGITATVNEIDLFTTTLDTTDNRRIIVPNTAIAAGTIENVSHHTERRVEVKVGCAYSADLRRTREVLTVAAEALIEKTIPGDGRGHQVVLGDLGDSAVGWTVRLWTTADQFWGVKEELTESIKNHLDEAGIGIPYPQIDVHVDNAA
ncbi:MAG: mechanosensitive ion channel [Fuerstiella sp.]|nr:mechanosensitive ion channel [Fuerstiella sp.]MCP4858352.1 mechanosensitive ion channel [Fuerstiella sp.]